jgi:hypothetical protein
MIESGLVYVYSITPTRRFVGCGALVEGGYVATCRHVWAEAAKPGPGGEPEVEIEYPHAPWEGGAAPRRKGTLADACNREDGPTPDLVLLSPAEIPSGPMVLSLAVQDRFQTGPGYAHIGLAELNQRNELLSLRDLDVSGVIAATRSADERRQFTGDNLAGYWSRRGSSGSPVFVAGQQLAGILSLSELGGKHEAFVVPGTVIRQYVVKLRVRDEPVAKGIDPVLLQPVLAAIGASDLPINQVPARLQRFVEKPRRARRSR